MSKKKNLHFSKETLEEITEMLKDNSLSDVARHFGTNDNRLKYEKKLNPELDAAIVKGVESRVQLVDWQKN